MATSLEQRPQDIRGAQIQVASTSFLSLFAIVGLALYGLPFFYDFMVRDSWSAHCSDSRRAGSSTGSDRDG